MAVPADIEFVYDEPVALTDELVYDVEKFLGVKLPEAYISLMKRHNGGYVSGYVIKVESAVPPPIKNYLGDGYVYVGSISGVTLSEDSAPSITSSPSIISSPEMTEGWGLPRGLVLLDGDGHTWLALDYRQAKENPPVIYIVSLEGHHVTIAHNFEDFIRRLVPYEDVYDLDGNLKQ